MKNYWWHWIKLDIDTLQIPTIAVHRTEYRLCDGTITLNWFTSRVIYDIWRAAFWTFFSCIITWGNILPWNLWSKRARICQIYMRRKTHFVVMITLENVIRTQRSWGNVFGMWTFEFVHILHHFPETLVEYIFIIFWKFSYDMRGRWYLTVVTFSRSDIGLNAAIIRVCNTNIIEITVIIYE